MFGFFMLVLRIIVRGFMSGVYKPLGRLVEMGLEKIAPFPIYIPLPGGLRILFLKPNVVSVGRATIPIPLIHYYLGKGDLDTALWVFIVAGVLDFVDGRLAAICSKMGYPHNGVLGKFLDPACDKFLWGGAGVVALLHLDFSQIPSWLGYTILLALAITAAIEVIQMKVRWEDFVKATKGRISETVLKSERWGKLKFTLQLVGLGGLIYGGPTLDTWPGYVAAFCIPFSTIPAWMSLRKKLRTRQRIQRRRLRRQRPSATPAG